MDFFREGRPLGRRGRGSGRPGAALMNRGCRGDKRNLSLEQETIICQLPQEGGMGYEVTRSGHRVAIPSHSSRDEPVRGRGSCQLVYPPLRANPIYYKMIRRLWKVLENSCHLKSTTKIEKLVLLCPRSKDPGNALEMFFNQRIHRKIFRRGISIIRKPFLKIRR